MIHSVRKYAGGYVKIRIEGYSPERFLNMCSYHHIFLWGMTPKENAYEMYMTVEGFRKIRPIARKTHTKVSVVKRYGFPFFLHRNRKRKLFAAGMFVCIVLLKLYSMFIWDIHFTGNEKWTDETLIRFFETMDVHPGMLKSRVDCQKINEAIREQYKDIVWVSASLEGSLLNVRIKENEDMPAGESETGDMMSPTDLTAGSDGVITSMITRSGVPQVHPGDTVKKGDVLVLGRIEVLNDSGEVTGYRYCQADADIFADTEISYTDTIPLQYRTKEYDGKWRMQIFIRTSGLELALGTLKNHFENSDISSYERQLKTGENFYLPLSVGYRKVSSYSLHTEKYSETEIREILTGNFQRFCEELEEKGVQIRGNSVKIQLGNTSATASGLVYVNEKIGKEAETEMITIERKEQHESGGTDD